jgi:hypothetical protein
MLKDFYERIMQDVAPKIIEVDEKPFCKERLNPVKAYPATMNIHTLDGLVKYTNTFVGRSNGFVVVINSPESVTLTEYDATWNETYSVVHAKCFTPSKPFEYGKKYDVEEFIINLQANFAMTDDRNEILKCVSTLTSGTAQTHVDNGISQTVTVKKGISLKGEKEIKSHHTLCPYRTFHEVQQPHTDYVLRIYQDENTTPKVALFEAEGGNWQLEAVLAIKEYLDEKLDAEHMIPVIA